MALSTYFLVYIKGWQTMPQASFIEKVCPPCSILMNLALLYLFAYCKQLQIIPEPKWGVGRRDRERQRQTDRQTERQKIKSQMCPSWSY